MSDLAKTLDEIGKAVDGEVTEVAPELAATMMQPESNSGSGTEITTDGFPKQCRDLAFAMAVLESGFLTRRSLELATRSWSAHGNKQLSDHLVATAELPTDQCGRVNRIANRKLAQVASLNGVSESSLNGSGGPHRIQHWVSYLDPNGKVAKLLGIADTSVLSHDEMEDRQVGSRYTLLRKLGQGGLGVVWLARDQNLQRYVAVKEISRDVAAGDPALDHFRREAEITGRLEHPGIVPVYQYGEDEVTGKSFYVMQFLGKRTMQDAITEYHERREAGNHDPMMRHRLLQALISVCHSIGHAHSRKVIHRDLKPENIALDEFGQVTVLDWGLAKINDATGMYDVNGQPEPGDLHSVGSTHGGRVLGTPLYMAPEQAAGRLDEVDELTDVYALGGILYAILTGLAPHQQQFDASSGSGRQDIVSEIVSGSIADPTEVLSSVPAELAAVCMKALSDKRYLRYESAEEFGEELQRFIAGSPVTAYTPPLKQRMKRWMAKHPTQTQAILLVTTLLVIGGSAVAYMANRGRTALQQAKYQSVEQFARKLEVNLDFETQSLVRNLQFITELPLTDAVVMTQRNAADAKRGDASSNNVPPAEAMSSRLFRDLDPSIVDAMSEVSADQWLDRQGNVLDGLLKAHPPYLVAAVCIREEDGSIRELVRSQRTQSGRRVRRVPMLQLKTCEPRPDSDETKTLVALRPDEVALITNDQLSEDIPVANRSPLVLSGVCGVFGPEGELFGMNIIELDLRERLSELCIAVAPENVSVAVTDIDGNVVLRYEDRRFKEPKTGESIVDEFPKLKELFSPNSAISEFGDGQTVFAHRVHLGGPMAKAEIGIVAHIHEHVLGD